MKNIKAEELTNIARSLLSSDWQLLVNEDKLKISIELDIKSMPKEGEEELYKYLWRKVRAALSETQRYYVLEKDLQEAIKYRHYYELYIEAIKAGAGNETNR